MRILGIETSCDETGLAIYDSQKGLLANALHSQIPVHIPYGGVVPELASRDHVKRIYPLLHDVLQQAGLSKHDLDGIAYTKGPGLVGALLVGACFARTLAFALNKPAIGIHHLEGHLLAPFLEPNPPLFPHLALLISGGHTEFIVVKAIGQYRVIGDTLDDAVGEAFDKTAKLLGLPYPGGAQLSQLARRGKPSRYQFPRPMVSRAGLDFSFSGLKTFASNTLKELSGSGAVTEQDRADIARAFEDAVVDTMRIKVSRALADTGLKHLVVAGGVSANLPLRETLTTLCHSKAVSIYYPRPAFCTDNGAMIAYAGAQRLLRGEKSDLTVAVSARLSIEKS